MRNLKPADISGFGCAGIREVERRKKQKEERYK
jgi:hypothetical protein